MKQIVVFSGYIKNEANAGPKAKIDIERILVKKYNAKIVTLESTKTKISTILQKILFYLKPLFSFNSIIVIQYPVGRHYLRTLNKNKILIIHDIDGLRNQDIKKLDKEIKYFNKFKYIVAHNEKMRDYLINNGVKSKIYTINLFDYLINEENKQIINTKKVELVYAGNIVKSEFYKHLDSKSMNYTMNVYAATKPPKTNNKIIYKGCYAPDELPSKVKGNLGLVWDGDIDDMDQFYKFKNYTRYNNPHKLSCYLASNIPVIVWDKSAASHFVEENQVGYVINEINDINNIDLSSYNKILKKVHVIHDKIVNGEYTIEVMDKIFKDMGV